VRRLYTLLLTLALPLATVVVGWRGLRNREYWRGWRERFGRGAALPGQARGLWVHAVSVGEVQAATSLVRAMQARWPGAPLAVTSATPAGRTRAGAALGGSAHVRYAPYDLPWCVRAAMRRLRPGVLVIMEAEIWPGLLRECALAGIPVLFASARLSARSAARWQRFGALLQPALGSCVTVAAQSAADARRFESLGLAADRVHVCGNIKFDRIVGSEVVAAGSALRRRYAPARPLWVAGSTHPGEETAVLQAHAALRRTQADALLVLAPRHQPRFDDVGAILDRSGLSWQRHSAARAAHPSTGPGSGVAAPAVLLLDTIGELESFYAAADAAFVGGSLVPVGGHNLLEPAALAVPTLAGPHQNSAPDVARLLVEGGGLRIVSDGAALAAGLSELMRDATERRRIGRAAQATVDANRGALGRTLDLVAALVRAPVAPAS